MKTVIALLLSALMYQASFSQEIPEPNYAKEFFKISDNKLIPLEKNTFVIKNKGFVSVEVLAVFNGVRSSAVFSVNDTIKFIFKSDNLNLNPDEYIVLIPLKTDKKNRFYNLAEPPKIAAEFEKYGQSSYILSSTSPLQPGEYALYYDKSNYFFLFSVQ